MRLRILSMFMYMNIYVVHMHTCSIHTRYIQRLRRIPYLTTITLSFKAKCTHTHTHTHAQTRSCIHEHASFNAHFSLKRAAVLHIHTHIYAHTSIHTYPGFKIDPFFKNGDKFGQYYSHKHICIQTYTHIHIRRLQGRSFLRERRQIWTV